MGPLEPVEITARTESEAVSQALEQLGLDRSQVEVEVIGHERRGLLGLGGGEVTVRVTPAVTDPVEPEDAADAAPPPGVEEEAPVPEAEAELESDSESETSAVDDQDALQVSDLLPSEEEEPEPETTEEKTIQDWADEACFLVQDIVDGIGVKGQAVITHEADDEIHIEIEGRDVGLVIGRQGRTLNAIQYLTNVIMNRRSDHRLRVVVDAERYRERRERSLERTARQAADRVRRTGRPYRTEPMRAADRRIIHLTLQDEDDIFTYSEGDEPHRCVIVALTEDQERAEKEEREPSFAEIFAETEGRKESDEEEEIILLEEGEPDGD